MPDHYTDVESTELPIDELEQTPEQDLLEQQDVPVGFNEAPLDTPPTEVVTKFGFSDQSMSRNLARDRALSDAGMIDPFEKENNSFLEGLGAGASRATASMLQTAQRFGVGKDGLSGVAVGLRDFSTDFSHNQRYNQDFSLENFGGWFSYHAGSGVGNSLPMLIGTVATGGLGGAVGLAGTSLKVLTVGAQLTSSFATIYSDELAQMEVELDGKASREQIEGLALLSSVLQSAVEVGIGADAAMARSITKRMAWDALTDIPLRSGGRAMLKDVGKKFLWGVPWKSFKGAVGESSEEIMQRYTSEFSMKSVDSDRPLPHLWDVFTDEGMAALPAGMLFGGGAAIMESSNDNLAQRIAHASTPDQANKVLRRMNATAIKQFQTKLDEINDQLIEGGAKPEDAQAAVAGIKRLCLGMANVASENKNGAWVDPTHYLESFQIKMASNSLTVEEAKQIEGMSQEEAIKWLEEKGFINQVKEENLDRDTAEREHDVSKTERELNDELNEGKQALPPVLEDLVGQIRAVQRQQELARSKGATEEQAQLAQEEARLRSEAEAFLAEADTLAEERSEDAGVRERFRQAEALDQDARLRAEADATAEQRSLDAQARVAGADAVREIEQATATPVIPSGDTKMEMSVVQGTDSDQDVANITFEQAIGTLNFIEENLSQLEKQGLHTEEIYQDLLRDRAKVLKRISELQPQRRTGDTSSRKLTREQLERGYDQQVKAEALAEGKTEKEANLEVRKERLKRRKRGSKKDVAKYEAENALQALADAKTEEEVAQGEARVEAAEARAKQKTRKPEGLKSLQEMQAGVNVSIADLNLEVTNDAGLPAGKWIPIAVLPKEVFQSMYAQGAQVRNNSELNQIEVKIPENINTDTIINPIAPRANLVQTGQGTSEQINERRADAVGRGAGLEGLSQLLEEAKQLHERAQQLQPNPTIASSLEGGVKTGFESNLPNPQQGNVIDARPKKGDILFSDDEALTKEYDDSLKPIGDILFSTDPDSDVMKNVPTLEQLEEEGGILPQEAMGGALANVMGAEAQILKQLFPEAWTNKKTYTIVDTIKAILKAKESGALADFMEGRTMNDTDQITWKWKKDGEPTKPVDVGLLRSKSIENIISFNGKTALSVDWALASCVPTSACPRCYAASTIQGKPAMTVNYLRNLLWAMHDPIAFGDAVVKRLNQIAEQDNQKSIEAYKGKHLRFNSYGDIGYAEQVQAINHIIANMPDGTVGIIFSRNHTARWRGQGALDQLVIPDSKNVVVNASVDAQLVDHYGIEALKALPKKWNISYLWVGDPRDVSQFKTLLEADMFPIIHMDQKEFGVGADADVSERQRGIRKDIQQAYIDAGYSQMTHLAALCPCSVRLQTGVASCAQCQEGCHGCFRWMDIAMDEEIVIGAAVARISESMTKTKDAIKGAKGLKRNSKGELMPPSKTIELWDSAINQAVAILDNTQKNIATTENYVKGLEALRELLKTAPAEALSIAGKIVRMGEATPVSFNVPIAYDGEVRALPKRKRPAPKEGTRPAVKADDGTIYVGKAKDTQADVIKDHKIPAERVVSAGAVVDGVFDETLDENGMDHVHDEIDNNRDRLTVPDGDVLASDDDADTKPNLKTKKESTGEEIEQLMSTVMAFLDQYLEARNRPTSEVALVKEIQKKVKDDLGMKVSGQQVRDILTDSGKAKLSGVRGHYMTRHQLAIFYKNASPDVIIHEFFHHMRTQKLIPTAMEDRLLKALGKERWDESAEEAAAKALQEYLGGKRSQSMPASVLQDLMFLRESMKAFWGNVTGKYELNTETEAWFDEVFSRSEQLDRKISGYQYKKIGDTVEKVITATVLASQDGQEKVMTKLRQRFGMTRDDFLKAEGYDPRQFLIEAGYKGYAYAANSEGTQDTDMTEAELNKAIDLLRTERVMKLQSVQAQIKREKKEGTGLSEEQLRNKQFKKLTEIELREGQRQRKKLDDMRAQEIAGEIESRPDHYGMKTRSAGGAIWWRRIVDTARKLRNFIAFAEPLLLYMDDGNRDGVFTKNFWNKISKAGSVFADNYSTAISRVSDKIKSLGGIPENLQSEVQIAGQTFTFSEVVGIYMHSQGGDLNHDFTKSMMEHNSGQVTKEVVMEAKRIVESDPKMKNYVAVIQDYMGDVWGRLAPVAQKVTGRDIGNLGAFYLPFVHEDMQSAEVGGISALEQLELNVTPEERLVRTPSQVKQRGLKGSGKLNLNSLELLLRYMQTAENYIAKAESVEQMINMLDNPTLSNEIRMKFGDDTYQSLRNMITREMSPSGRAGAMMPAEAFLRQIRSKAVSSMLGMNPFTVLRQPVSLLNAMTELEVVSTVGNFMKTFFYALPRLANVASPFSELKADALLAGNEDFENMLEQSSVLKMRAQHGLIDPDFQNMMEQRYSNTELEKYANKKGGIIKAILNRGLTAIRMADMVTVTSVYTTARDAYLAEHKDATLADAVEYAEHVVRKTQPPTSVSERSQWQTSNEYLRTAIPFTGQLFKNLNVYTFDIIMPVLNSVQGKDVTKTQKMNRLGGALWKSRRAVMFAVVLPSMVLGMIARRRPPKKDELFKDLFAYPLAAFPILGAGASRQLQGWDNDSYQAIWLDLANAISSLAVDTIGFDLDWSSLEDVQRLALLWSGMPQYPARVLNNFIREMEASGTAESLPEFFELVKDSAGFESKAYRK